MDPLLPIDDEENPSELAGHILTDESINSPSNDDEDGFDELGDEVGDLDGRDLEDALQWQERQVITQASEE
jgi:hypothetical protein